MDRQMNGWMNIKNRLMAGWTGWIEKMDGWMEKQYMKNIWMVEWIYIFFKDRWTVGWQEKKEGWLD